MTTETPEKNNFKVCLVGQEMAGKTMVQNCLMKKGYSEKYNPGLSVDFGFLEVQTDERAVGLILWDISGCQQFGNLLRIFFKETDYFVIIFDINTDSLQNIQEWIERIKRFIEMPSIALMRTKIDLNAGNDLSEGKKNELEKIESFAKEEGYHYFEVSAKEKTNISESFQAIGNSLLEKMKNPPALPAKIVHKKEIEIINNEIFRLSSNQRLIDSDPSYKVKHLRILRDMLSDRIDKSTAELVDEWKAVEVEVKTFGFTKTITRDELMKTHRNWLSSVFSNDTETTSAKTISSLYLLSHG